MSEYHKMYLGGEWVDSAQKLPVQSPYDLKEIGTVALASNADYTRAIEIAAKTFAITRELPSYKREAICLAIAAGLEENIESFARSLVLEVGKTHRDATTEVRRAVSVFRTAAEEAKRIGGDIIDMDWTAGSEERLGLIRRFPLGVVAGISPFNYPLNLTAHKIAPAIASGNCMILKPASKTPINALMLAELIDRTDLPKGAISILPAPAGETVPLIEDPRVKLITFTGSPEVGWWIKERAKDKKVVLELGGNAGVAVADDADLELAASRLVIGAFGHAGQSCISVQRIYLQEKIYEPFLDIFKEKIAKLKVGDPLDPTVDVGPMIDDASASRIEGWINNAVKNGARIIAGGKRHERILEPTLLADVKPDMEVCFKEAFAPLAIIFKYKDFREVVAEINRSDYGLQAGIFTNRIKDIFYAFKHLDVGGVMINDISTYRADHQPYGGVKKSGVGREGVKYAIEDMTEMKILGLNLK
ncbi:putative aldehyde-dehydrogenase-like protein y4uC [Candidatus Zixiibacteriota bacterium]|nr:putative aldehyde-dehydrogenase-like protein y4uC [candidate division Zixibacteria bacterium]